MFALRIVVFYITTIGEQVWHGSNTTMAPTMYIPAATIGDAEAMVHNSGLVPNVGDSWGMGSVVTQVDVELTEAPDVAIAPF